MSTSQNNDDIKTTPSDAEFDKVKLNTWENIKKFLFELFDIQTDM